MDAMLSNRTWLVGDKFSVADLLMTDALRAVDRFESLADFLTRRGYAERLTGRSSRKPIAIRWPALLQRMRPEAGGSAILIAMRTAPPDGEAVCVGASVPIGAGPDQLQALFALDLDQGGVDRCREARVVELDREVVAIRLFGVLLPGRTEFDVAGGVDPEVRTLVAGILDADELGLDVEVEGLDRAGEAVLGQLATVFLK